MEKDVIDVDAGRGDQHGEVSFVVEKGSPADRILQVLKNHKFDAEITALEVKGGGAGRHQLVKVEGVICGKGAASSVMVWAILLPSGMAYLLGVQGPGETDIPLLPRIYELLLKGEAGAAGDGEDGKEGGETP